MFNKFKFLIIGLVLAGTSMTVQAGIPGPSEIWHYVEYQVTPDFIADGGDLYIDAGDVTLDATCSSNEVSCLVANCPPAASPPVGVNGPLNVKIDTVGGYELVEVHMDAEETLSDIPQTRNNNPKVGKFETHAEYDILSSMISWNSDVDDDFTDGNPLFIALHGVVFIPGDCNLFHDDANEDFDGFYSSCDGPFNMDVEACMDELDNCSGDTAWAEGTGFTTKRNWAMYLEVDDTDFCMWEKKCDSNDGSTCI